MADTTITVVGNLTREADLRYTTTGSKAVCNFSIANNRLISKPGEPKEEAPSFFDVTAWDSLALNVADLPKGTRLVVTGRVQQDTWEAEDGSKRSKLVIIAEEVGASLRWASVQVTKNERPGNSEASAASEMAETF